MGLSPVQRDLKRLLKGGGKVLTEPCDIEPLLIDWRVRFAGVAGAVVQPKTASEVEAIVRYAVEKDMKITLQGGNTGMCGGASPQSEQTILLNLSKLKSIRQYSPEGRYIIAEAGVTVEEINAHVKEDGLFLPIAFGATGSASLGGVISTNAGGMNVLRYGTAREQVLGLEVVLADGGRWDGLRVLRKDNSGPDLKHMFIGTEGTLGIITAAVMRLQPIESHTATVLLEAEDMDGVIRLASLAHHIGAERLSSFELLSGFALSQSAVRVLRISPPLGGGGKWYALARFAASGSVDDLALEFAEKAFESGLAVDGTIPKSLAEEAQIWHIRDSLSELHRYLGPSHRFDIGVPIDQLARLVAELEALMKRYVPDADALIFGHMGDGNLHFSICSADDKLPDHEKGFDLKEIVHEIVWSLGGTISAEHGIGRLHIRELYRQKPPIELAVAARMKAALDPDNRLNPGVIFQDVQG